jgi:hypothetical protein
MVGERARQAVCAVSSHKFSRADLHIVQLLVNSRRTSSLASSTDYSTGDEVPRVVFP